MHTHTDKPCKHDLKVCTHCGDVYCSKCNKEWFRERYTSYPYWISGSAVYTTGDTSVLSTTNPEPPAAHIHQ